jgi:K+-transporting ATPase KdpF subunit
MSALFGLAGALAIALTIYLFVALCYPEKLQ